MRGLYKADVFGPSGRVRSVELRTVSECRAFAEEFGTTADWCIIYDWKGRQVGEHRRGVRGWYRAPWLPGWKVA